MTVLAALGLALLAIAVLGLAKGNGSLTGREDGDSPRRDGDFDL